MKKKVRKNKVKKFLQGLKKVKIKTGKFRMNKITKEDLNNAIPMERFSVHQDNPDFWYRAVEQDEFPMGQYLKDKTGKGITHNFKNDYNRGSKICHHLSDLNNIIKKYGFTQVYLCDTYDDEEKVVNSRIIYEISDSTGAVLLNAWNVPTFLNKSTSDKKTRVYLSLYSNINPQLYDSIKKDLISSYKTNRIPQNNVNLVIASPHGYDTEQFDLPKQKIDIELNYGKDFVPVHKKIIESLNTQKSKGLVLLHGDPGTGKTHYLKYIASKVKDKKVLFIPPYLADFITSPEMTPFLIDNANSVLFIEDAERVITDRSENGSTGVANILNITDGILSDILNIQIVATFNMDRQKIDSALLRKGRLIAEHKFGPLTIEESNKLIKHLGLDYTADKAMTLTEIYNCKDVHYVSDSTEKRRIGFGSN